MSTILTIASIENKDAGDEVSVAISIDTDSGDAISALDLVFKFDPDQLEPLFPVASAGSLTQSWGAPVANASNGSLAVSLASANPLTDNTGEILILNFRINSDAHDPITIDLDQTQSLIQEGEVEFTAIDGTIAINHAPTNLALSDTAFDENNAAGALIAALSTTDPDLADTHTYALVSGDGDTDNAAFSITGDQLLINASADYESQSSYTIRLASTDSAGNSVEQSVTLSVNDIKLETIHSSTNYTLPANVENLVLTGTANLKGYGNSSNNHLTGNSGNNLLDGKGGGDVMSGKGGNDTYIVNHGKDRVIEKAGGGTDTIRSSVTETLSANVENLVLTGTANLKGYGNSSNNHLTGNSGNNVLEGKAGRDILTGKGGGDKFVYRSTNDSGITKSTRDIITDFDGTASDVIDLSKIDAYTAKSGNQMFVYIGSDSFSGTQGEVRFASGILSVNTGTDTTADMQIKLNGVTEFSSEFLIL